MNQSSFGAIGQQDVQKNHMNLKSNPELFDDKRSQSSTGGGGPMTLFQAGILHPSSSLFTRVKTAASQRRKEQAEQFVKPDNAYQTQTRESFGSKENHNASFNKEVKMGGESDLQQNKTGLSFHQKTGQHHMRTMAIS